MKMKTAVVVGITVFCLSCAGLIAEAVFHHPQQTKDLLGRVVPLAAAVEEQSEAPAVAAEPQPVEPAAQMSAAPMEYPELTAKNADAKHVMLGTFYETVERSSDPGRYKFAVLLTSKGAAVRNVFSTEFEAREEAAETEVLSAHGATGGSMVAPLNLLSAVDYRGGEIYSLANTSLKIASADAKHFGRKSFPLDQLNWNAVQTDAANEARFEAVLSDGGRVDGGVPPAVLRLIKTYRIEPGSYDIQCEITAENLSGDPIKVLMQMQGPIGMQREDIRQDTRKIKAAYQKDKSVEVQQLDITAMQKKMDKNDIDAFLLKSGDASPIWSALTNKYFAAIVYDDPLAAADQPRIHFSRALYYPAPTTRDQDKDLKNCSFDLTGSVLELAAAGQGDAEQTLSFKMYVGPKDKNIFEKNETYKALQFFQTVDFKACCCPASVIAPMAFGIMWLMNTMYMLMGPLGNYGVVIMILVFLVRLALHPITKKSQVSMMKMQKLGPKMQEIQAKYANNKQEMNKQIMAMYRDFGVSPVSGMLPMFLQMPIWIALWTAVYTSVDLRGAGFLPFWITDLSMPDQLFAIPYAAKLQTLAYVGKYIPSYFNLLPILMGVVMYIQQKMMPTSQASAQTNPQIAQQQKMMMIMMPLLFPIMLYTGPSGVNLYIMSSITAGVIEQKVIRKHLKEKEELEAVGKVPVTAKTGGKVKKKKPKPFFKG